jgi:hypothetical protein
VRFAFALLPREALVGVVVVDVVVEEESLAMGLAVDRSKIST